MPTVPIGRFVDYSDSIETLQEWMDEGRARIDVTMMTPSREAYLAYKTWCESRADAPISNKRFTQALVKMGCKVHRRTQGSWLLHLAILPANKVGIEI